MMTSSLLLLMPLTFTRTISAAVELRASHKNDENALGVWILVPRVFETS